MFRLYRGRVVAATVFLCLATAVSPGLAAAAPLGDRPALGLSADLDGKPISLADVGAHYCQDFSHSAIHCFSRAADLEASVAATTATSGVTYVVIYDYPLYAGSYMYLSQDYTALVWIGWNDRVSSFSVRNYQEGHFYTNWFYDGTGYYFCCNQQVAALGSYDNTFSSVHVG